MMPFFLLQYIDSEDLEPTTLQEEPVKYHEAWQKLCSSQWVVKSGEASVFILQEGNTLILFVPHGGSRDLSFPMVNAALEVRGLFQARIMDLKFKKNK